MQCWLFRISIGQDELSFPQEFVFSVPDLSTVEEQTCQLDALVMLVGRDQYHARSVAASAGVPVLQWHARRILMETIFQGDALATEASMVR